MIRFMRNMIPEIAMPGGRSDPETGWVLNFRRMFDRLLATAFSHEQKAGPTDVGFAQRS